MQVKRKVEHLTNEWMQGCKELGVDPSSVMTSTSTGAVGEIELIEIPGKTWVGSFFEPVQSGPEYSGGSSSYYIVDVKSPTTPASKPYTAECNDIIEALGMNYAEGNAFKALWRRAAQRTLGKRKAGAKDDGLYDAEKVEFFGARLVEQSKQRSS